MVDYTQSLIHNNLLMLGRFHAHAYKLKDLLLKENMFDFPNKTGFEHVVYYLLSIVAPARLQSSLRWPLHCPNDSVIFRNTIKDVILALNNEYPEAKIPHVTSYVLMSYRGVKCVSLIHRLSFFVLQMQTEQAFGNFETKCDEIDGSGRILMILKPSRLKVLAHTNLIETYPVLSRDNEGELVDLESLLNTKKNELVKLIECSPEVYRDQLYKFNLREDAFYDWKKKIDEQASKKRVKLQSLKTLKSIVARCCYYLDDATESLIPLVIDGEQIKEKFKTKAAFSFSERNRIQLYRNGKLSLEGLLDLGNCYIKSLSPDKHGINLSTSDLECVLLKIQSSSRTIVDLRTSSEEAYTLLSNLRQSLVSSCLRLDSYISKTVNENPIYCDLISTPPVVFSVPEDHSNLFLSPEEGGSPWLQRLRETYHSADLTPIRGGNPLQRAKTEKRQAVGKKMVCNLLDRRSSIQKMTSFRECQLVSPLPTVRAHHRSSPSLIRSAIEKRHRCIKRPKTAPETSSPKTLLIGVNQSPSVTVGYTERESEETIRELFSMTSDDEIGSPSPLTPQKKINSYDDFFDNSGSDIAKEEGEQEKVSKENKANNNIERGNDDIREIIERFKKIKAANSG